ncbi:MAG: HNH endonuclease [Acidobacteriota bacterium]|nr:HNH endonuclease [Acidobacteriota bacterium]
MARRISADVREKVRQRATFLCEYCHTNERWQYVRFTIDHIIPNGDDSIENLALACFHCNRRKSNKTEILDTKTNEIISLFNPREHFWNEHFIWSNKILIVPKTTIGRVTIELLKLNRERILRIREADVVVNRHPPPKDLT